ncbi:hypothetical protein [Minwuia sp.]|uniref:hypothetical protein n=1 Tax=Minwuia sp. TaxID=2493630 RepID=UPI003A923698
MARRRRRGPGIAIGSSFGGFAILGCGLLLGGLALPKVASTFAATTGEAVVERLKEGKPVGEHGLSDARASFENAIRFLPSDYRAPRDLALVELLAAQRLEDVGGEAQKQIDKDRAEHLATAISASRRSLSNNPAQPYVWLRLSQAELLARGVGVEAALAYTMSLETGPQVIDLMQPRVVLGLVLWPILDDRQRNRVLAQIRGLARYNPRILAETVLHRPGLPQVRQALADEPELMNAFLRWYLKRRTPGLRLPTN